MDAKKYGLKIHKDLENGELRSIEVKSQKRE